MTPQLLVKTYHLSTFSIILSSFIYNQLYVKDEHGGGLLDYKGFGGKFKYLTFWFFVCWIGMFAVMSQGLRIYLCGWQEIKNF